MDPGNRKEAEVLHWSMSIVRGHDEEPVIAVGGAITGERPRRAPYLTHLTSALSSIRRSKLPRNGMAPKRPAR